MDPRPQPDDRFRVPALRRWNVALWLVLGLAPNLIAAADDEPGPRTWSLVLLAVISAGYVIMEIRPGVALRHPYPFLATIVAALAGLSYLRGVGAALYVVLLPAFWLFARGPRSAIAVSTAAAAATVVAGVLGPDPEAGNAGNIVFTLIACAASIIFGLLLLGVTRHGDEQARRLTGELDAAQQRLAEAHQRQGATEERERIAREIHDTLAQGFASIIVLAEAARSTIHTDPAKSGQQLHSIERTARDNLTEARVLVGSAPQSGLTPGTITGTLRRTLDRFAEDTGLAVDSELGDVECDQQTRIALLRCTQEALANVRKHAGASTVSVVLTRHPGGIDLEITDDGRGFVVAGSHGFGLDGMRKRLAELGGELTVTSSPGYGTRILASLPAHAQE
jgi:signal transduction histidine kinase